MLAIFVCGKKWQDDQELKVVLSYTVSSSPAYTTQDPVLKKKY